MTKRAADTLAPGDWIGGEYRVRRVLGGSGRSGMGAVYLAENYGSENLFVVKTFQLQAGIKLAMRFQQEAEAWIRLGVHPNVVQCFWVKAIGNQLHAGAEYVPPDANGRNSLEHALSQGRIGSAELVGFSVHFCYAMMHALRSGIRAHRDIKPENLMLTGAGTLKVTDFGLAKLVEGDADISKRYQTSMPKA